MPNAIITSTHPDYTDQQRKRELVMDAYTGDDIEKHLTRREQFESKKEFKERKSISAYTSYFGNILDAHTGVLFQHSPERDFGLLGDPENRQDVAYQVFKDVDGRGKNYNTMVREAANQLQLKHEAYALVDGLDAYGVAPVHLIPADDVVNWTDDYQRVKIRRDVEHPDFENAAEEDDDYYTVFSPEGYEHIRVNGDGDVISEGRGEFSQMYRSISGRPVPPVVRVELPIPRFVTHNLAEQSIAIYEAETVRDMSLRTSGFGFLQISAEDRETAQDILDGFERGDKVAQISPEASRDHKYISPNFQGTEARREDVKHKIENLYRTGFKELQQKAQLYNPATEILSNNEKNRSAYVSVIAYALEELENQVLHLLEQTHFPDRQPESRVEWPKRFAAPRVEIAQGTQEDIDNDNDE